MKVVEKETSFFFNWVSIKLECNVYHRQCPVAAAAASVRLFVIL